MSSFCHRASSPPRSTTTARPFLLIHGIARILLAGDAEANEEEYMANGPYTGPLTMIINVPNPKTI
jgi:hypothetical protein